MWASIAQRWKNSLARKSDQTSRKLAAAAVEEVLRESDLDPVNVEIETDDPALRQWVFRAEESAVVVILRSSDDSGLLHVFAPLLRLPSGNVLPFYRRLLELNCEMINAAFSVDGDTVQIETSRPLVGIDPVEVRTAVLGVLQYKEEYDTDLQSEFGAPPVTWDEFTSGD